MEALCKKVTNLSERVTMQENATTIVDKLCDSRKQELIFSYNANKMLTDQRYEVKIKDSL